MVLPYYPTYPYYSIHSMYGIEHTPWYPVAQAVMVLLRVS